MNKGFFVIFLGIILGAMALIFLNQTMNPAPPVTADSVAEQSEPAPETGAAGQSAALGEERAVASARPETSSPQTLPAPVEPEPAQPVPAKPEPAKPEPVQPEPAKPEPAKTEPVQPGPVKPEPAKTETPARPMTAVTATPETPAKPAAGETPRKSVTLVNIGLHFKNNGMALRIEADAPFSYKTFALPSPDRYVVDLVGTWKNMRAPKVPANLMIKSARVGAQPGGPRLVLDMQRAPKKHNVTWITPTILEILVE